MDNRITVTHRGTKESISKKQNEMLLRANYPTTDNIFMRYIEDRNRVVWVSMGRPSILNMIWSGMVGKRNEACIIFKIDKSRLRRPNGICKWMYGTWLFGKAQMVIDGDVIIPEDAEFKYKNL
ncbi:hypothetical protein [Clostridium sp. OS1-26]|uniref:hypothetical protein n=1 Tax=Clostridium sp. OS1-26 TaxID=3070681 RepID=UPI0027E1DD26|nr:hypothetical protein [Clostridium sp. OS1-26]WML35334.1 hypothetical protein RCG18_00790 [Clostridium sp. OS1-26]